MMIDKQACHQLHAAGRLLESLAHVILTWVCTLFDSILSIESTHAGSKAESLRASCAPRI